MVDLGLNKTRNMWFFEPHVLILSLRLAYHLRLFRAKNISIR
jgi:hypothetical protein